MSDLLDRLQRQGRLAWHRTPEPMRRIRDLGAGRWECVAAGKGPPDFVILAGGRAIVAEAKQTTLQRWPLQDLQEHQALALDRWERQGGMGVVLLLLRGRRWALRWRDLGPIWWRWFDGRAARGEASLCPESLPVLGVEMDGEGRWLTLVCDNCEARKRAREDGHAR